MEVMEFIKQKARMCDYYIDGCTRDCSREICPAKDMDCEFTTDQPERLVEIVEKWEKEHPEETDVATTHKNGEPCVKTIQDELEGAIYRAIASNKTRIENLEYDISVIRHNLSALHDKIYTLSEKVEHTTVIDPDHTTEPKRTNKDVLLAAFPDARMNNNGIPEVCPLSLDKHYDCDKFTDCEDCRCVHWNTEVDE